MKQLLSELTTQAEKLLHCVHCGFCLPACPTYSRLGEEADSPRGRLHLMRAVVEGRLDPASRAFGYHLDRCLGCRACESVCPSGVEYGHLLEGAREVLSRTRPQRVLDRLLPRIMATPAFLSPVMAVTRVLRVTRFPALAAGHLPSTARLAQLRLGLGMVAATATPKFAGKVRRRGISLSPGAAEDDTLGRGASAAVFLGCVQKGLLGRVNDATARVMESNGFRIARVRGQGCCGAIHAHTGDLEGARRLAKENIRAFEASGVEVIVANAAGCGATLKEYPHLLAQDEEYAGRARAMASRVRDVSELLGREGLRTGAPLPLDVTYDAPCHLLHAQRISEEPFVLLRSIPEVRLVPLPGHEECCGGAGLYGITHPELGGAVGREKVEAIVATGAEVVVTGNPGCMMQIGAGLLMSGEPIAVAHPVELLDESYRRAGFYGE
jgi:glycolate oxidase iron-sulfur subunit